MGAGPLRLPLGYIFGDRGAFGLAVVADRVSLVWTVQRLTLAARM